MVDRLGATIRAALGDDACGPAAEPELVSPREAARQIGCSVDTIKRRSLKHGIGGPLPTGRWLVDLAAHRALARRWAT